MRWFVLIAGLFLLGGFALGGYVTMIWLATIATPQLTFAQAELLDTAQWLTRNCAIMLGAFIFGWLAGQVH